MTNLVCGISLIVLVACAGGGGQVTPSPSGPAELAVMTHDSFSVTESLVARFEQDNNATVTFIKSGDAGAALNRAILSKNAPIADVFYGVDNTFLSRALQAEIFTPYASPLLAELSPELILDPQNRALPVDYGDVCINYDKAYFAENNLQVPASLEDLVKPDYRGLLVVENPATSSPGLAFLLATIVHFGPEDYLKYWQQLEDNDVEIASDWEAAYYTQFSGSSGRGPQPMVVSYGTSPAAEVVFADQPPEEAPTASIIGPDTCFRQVEFVGILQGARNQALAEKFVDFMLSQTFQEDLPLQMFVFPANQQAQLPEVFQKHIQSPDQPATMSPDEIAANRDRWIQSWTEQVLR